MPLTAEETTILESIRVRSDNDPNNPEFPADDPKFPATPTYQIEVPGFSNVWLKDESHNPTGTHKDRMAWEMVVTYRDFLLAKQRGQTEQPLTPLSIITSGSAAVAIQSQMKKYGLPSLKCLVDTNLDTRIIAVMQSIGCEIYQADLGRKPLTWNEILQLTDNPDGFDVTSNEALDPTTRFYDWLSYEVLNNSPDYCLIPFGTGNLYENVLNINKKELSSEETHDPRFSGDTTVLQKCHFVGVTTNNSDSKAEKLYSPHLPFVHFDEQWIRFYRRAGYCGNQSQVHLLQEPQLDEAIALASRLGIDAEPSGISGLAMLLQLKDQIPADAKILVVSTGKTKYPAID